MEDVVVTITKTVTVQRIADLLCCGFEGGVGYWCQIIGYKIPDNPRPILTKDKDYIIIVKHVDYPLTGGAVICTETDTEEPKKLVLDETSIRHGLQLLQEKSPYHWNNFIEENEDAVTGDVFIQYCLLGDIVYG